MYQPIYIYGVIFAEWKLILCHVRISQDIINGEANSISDHSAPSLLLHFKRYTTLHYTSESNKIVDGFIFSGSWHIKLFHNIVVEVEGAERLGEVKLFVFGDSYVDTGNLVNSISYKPPSGITFPGTPAGRFSDGRVLTDYIGTFCHRLLPHFTASFVLMLMWSFLMFHWYVISTCSFIFENKIPDTLCI